MTSLSLQSFHLLSLLATTLPSIKTRPATERTSASAEDNLDTHALDELVNQPAARKITWKKVLYHPLTWIAVGLHVALLWVPFRDRPPTAEIEVTEESSDESIPVDILNLSDIATSTPPPPKSETPPLPAAAPPAPAATPAASTAPTQAPQTQAPQTPTEPVAPPDPAAAPENTPPASGADSSPDPPPPPAYDPSADQGIFIQNLGLFGAVDTTAQTGLPPADSTNFFRKGNGQFFVSPAGEPAAGAKDARWMNQKPDQVLNTLTTSYDGALSFAEIGTYGDEPLYAATTAEGETAMFISLVDMKASTLMVIWPTDPNG